VSTVSGTHTLTRWPGAANPRLSPLQGRRLYTVASQAHRDGRTALVALAAVARARYMGAPLSRVAGAVDDAFAIDPD